MSLCSRCEIPAIDLPDLGTLYIATPLAHTGQTIAGVLAARGIPCPVAANGILSVPLAAGRLEIISAGLLEVLSDVELNECRTLILPDGAEPTMSDLMAMQPLAALLARVRGAWLTEIVHNGRLTTHFQPIVDLRRSNTVFGHECLLRAAMADNTLVFPGELFKVAGAAGLVHHLDRSARLTAVENAARHAVQGRIFINFVPTSIYDPEYCLRSTMAAVKESGLTPDRIVFEVVESAQAKDVKHLIKILMFYRDNGFQVALDDVGAGYSSLNLLSKLRPDFIKLDMELIQGVDTDPYKAQIAAKLLEMAGDLEIGTVVEGVETEGELEWVQRHGAHYAQGYLFARPACPPPAIQQTHTRPLSYAA